MILVTGATGFLGHELVESLLAEGRRVRILTRHGSSDARLDVVTGDISDSDTVENVMRGIDAVFHLATNSDHFAPYEEHRKTTIVGTSNVLSAAARNGVKKVVYMSTAAVTTKNKTNYTRAKAEAEDIARSYWGKIEVPIIRAPLIYDETILAKLSRVSWLPFPYKRQRIHLAYKRSVIDALIGALRYGSSEIYTVADSSPILLTELYKALASPRPMLWVPPQVIWLGIAAAYPVEWLMKMFKLKPFVTPNFIRYTFENRSFDIAKAVNTLKYSPVDTLEIVKRFKASR
jgi:nucleoside-diphosphate-sugar epimerase